MSSLIIITFIVFLVKFIIDLFPRSYSRPNSEMISNEQVANNVKENIRTQLISYNHLYLVDSLRNIYLLPVSQIKLEDPEELRVSYLKVPNYSYYMNSKQFNNMVIVNLNEQKNKILFKNRTCIVDYHIFSLNTKKYLFMLICNKDTNKDMILNERDLLELYLYDFENEKIEILSEKPDYILDLDFINRRNQVMVTIGIDRDNDNIFNRKYEPVILKRIDIESKEIVELMDEEVNDTLQGILDGINSN